MTRGFPNWTPAFEAVLGRLSLAMRRPAGSPYPGAARSRALGRAIEFADYRPYAAGDEPRLLDWRVYARTGRLYVKRHHEERERALTLLIDASGSLDFGSGFNHKGLFTRRLAAALAWISAARHEPARAWLLAGGTAHALAPVFTAADMPRLLTSLARVRETGRTGLEPAVRAALGSRPRGPPGPVVLLSDLLDASWEAACRALARHEAAIIQPLAPEELEPGLSEEVELEDAENGERLPTRLGPGEIEAYRNRLAVFLDGVRTETARQGVLHVMLRTDVSLADAVLHHLTRAGVLA